MKYCFLVTTLLLISLSACKTSKPVPVPPAEPVILTIGDKKFTTDEFFQSFTKNQFSDDTTKPTYIRDYLQLYTNLKLKVLGAQSEGRDTTASFREEMASYRKQLGQPYFNDKVLIDNLIAEAYERMKQEVRSSHILFYVPLDASPVDTLSAYRAITALRSRILQKEIDFESAAKQFSKDPASAPKGGDLESYFTVFKTVYPFETAAYTLPVGQISEPVRTKAGYHLIKVTDRRPSRGKVQVAHILISASSSATEEGKVAAKAKAEKAYNLLQQEAWEVVCRDYSDDATTKNDGGLLKEFGSGIMVTDFETAAFALSKVGEISKPIQTNYGWHIIKLVNRIPLESFAEAAPQLRQKVTTDSRSTIVKDNLYKKLRGIYKVTESGSVRDNTISKFDSTLLFGQWIFVEPLASSLEKKTLFQIDNKPYTVNQFYEYVRDSQRPVPEKSSAEVLGQRYYQEFINKKLVETEEENLEKKYPEFRALMNEMRDGVLFSQTMEANVWEPSLTDSLAQKKYWEQNKDKYRYPERTFATIMVSDSDTLLKRAQESLTSKPYQLRRKGTDLLFESKVTVLSEKHREALFDVALTMINNENYIVEVSSYGDSDEPDSLSSLRLRNAIKALTNDNVPLTRIIEKDYGKFKPVTTAARNRRVSFQFFSESKKDIEKALNALKIGSITLTEGAFAKGANVYLDATRWQVGNQIVNVNGKKAWVEISKVEPARNKTFAEARGAVINDSQKQLETNWLNRLRQKFGVQVNEEELKKLAK
ncbi:peptidylprolyl isomerase [Runella sp.]|uniref:peptidylprolyl isomerase n=1 Tax=Runella sp. TaxID=1960881 RepID=UPI00260E2963|nr:peptidylprolyl isomerase [Runella sp.]